MTGSSCIDRCDVDRDRLSVSRHAAYAAQLKGHLFSRGERAARSRIYGPAWSQGIEVCPLAQRLGYALHCHCKVSIAIRAVAELPSLVPAPGEQSAIPEES